MVALINEGTRSAKEGMAFQFKKSRRARLVGTATTGAFMGASFTFGRGDGYVLAIAATRLLLDGVQLEGVGVAPDVAVAYPLDRSLDRDPQLERAVEEIGAMLRSN